MSIKLKLPDGTMREAQEGASVKDVVGEISAGLLKAAVAAKLDGRILDLDDVLTGGGEFSVLTSKSPEYAEIFKHTAAHILAQAVLRLYPGTKTAIGPAIAAGYYYDLDFSESITLDDFARIEKEMEKIIAADYPIVREVVSKAEAERLFADNQYKLEILAEIADETVTVFRQGEFTDLCRGPHLQSTGAVKLIKLIQLTGAYWKGNDKNKMLTRVYGVAFEKKAELDAHLLALEEAKKRDHNKLGRELNYFMTEENIGQGLPLLMPRGAKVIQILSRFVEDEEQKRGYLYTRTPSMAKSDLYKISGHWDHYRDGMFVIDENSAEEVIALRPMTCPFQYMIYKNGMKSYRDLPVRYNETATLYRNENSGEMHGLIRVRQFTLSDGHIIVAPEQVEEEFRAVLELIYYLLKCVGLSEDITFRFSKWDPANREKYIDDEESWENTQNLMRGILDRLGLKYTEAVGEAAFYGPKLDLQIRNVYGKEDTIITVQVDFCQAERFDMDYVDADGVKKRPFIIHRSSIGCYERTLALLIEKFAGALPLWLMPVQAVVMSLTDRTTAEAKKIAARLTKMGIRAEADVRNEKLGYKIREAQVNKIPYMIIIGDKEKADKVVSVRSRIKGDLGTMPLAAIAKKIKQETESFDLTV